MEYFFKHVDTCGFTHSIDNVILEYQFMSTTYTSVKNMIPKVQQLKEKHTGINYYEKLDLNACRKYYFSKDFIHLDDGIMLYFGAQIEKLDKPLKNGEKWLTLPQLRLELNPNKHAGKDVLTDLLKILKSEVCDIRIIRYDYAIDLPMKPDDVQVFQTNKEKGLYKGTRYYGQRQKNGYTRIYDKQKEQGLDTPLTRVETIVSLTKGTKKLSFEKVFYKTGQKEETGKLTKTDKTLIELCERLRNAGLEYQDALNLLDARKRRFIVEQLNHAGYKRLELNEEIINDLLGQVIKYFDVTQTDNVKAKLDDEPEVDEDGFCIIPPEGYDLPFD